MASQEPASAYQVLVYSAAGECSSPLAAALDDLNVSVCLTWPELTRQTAPHRPSVVVLHLHDRDPAPIEPLPPWVSVLRIGVPLPDAHSVDLFLPPDVSPHELRRCVELAGRLAEARSMLAAYEERLAEAGARASALAAEINSQRAELEQLATTDPLTGLHNRRYLDPWLASQFLIAQRYQTGLAVVLLDLDRFKSINDTCTHAFGDRVLRTLASLLRGTLRSSDVVGRLGGDEFVILSAQIDPPGAARLAARLLERIAAHRFDSPSGELHITASAGASHFPTDAAPTAEELLHQADVALYAAKFAGRNRVCLFSDVPPAQ